MLQQYCWRGKIWYQYWPSFMKDKKPSDFWNNSTYSEYHQCLFFWSNYSFLLLIKFSAFTSTVKGARIVWRKHRLVSKESDTITAHPLTLVSWQQAPVPSVSKTLLPLIAAKSYLKYLYRDNGFNICSTKSESETHVIPFINPLIRREKIIRT